VIAAINSKISQCDQKIVKYNFGLTNKDFYIFHSTADTSMSKVQNSFNQADLEFFKVLFLTIVYDKNVRITPREALNLSSTIVGKITKVRAQKVLENWIEGAYFYQDDHHIYIGPKLLIEFKEQLQSMELNHVKSCSLCTSIAIWVSRLYDSKFHLDY
jgi:Nse1 non-SMC component of SMC5-6 complex